MLISMYARKGCVYICVERKNGVNLVTHCDVMTRQKYICIRIYGMFLKKVPKMVPVSFALHGVRILLTTM